MSAIKIKKGDLVKVIAGKDKDKEHTTELPEETVTAGSTEEVRFSITGEGRYSSKKIHIIAPAGKQVTVFMDYQTEEKLAVRTSLSVEEHARVRLVQLQHTADSADCTSCEADDAAGL